MTPCCSQQHIRNRDNLRIEWYCIHHRKFTYQGRRLTRAEYAILKQYPLLQEAVRTYAKGCMVRAVKTLVDAGIALSPAYNLMKAIRDSKDWTHSAWLYCVADWRTDQ